MSPKRIEYSSHAVQQMRARGITRPDVRWILAQGLPAEAETRRGEQRLAKRGYLDRREAKVVYLENAERIEVVTVMWVE
jgi:hypothetical protein